MGTGGVIYVLKAKIDGRDHWERIANTRTELWNFGGTELERAVVEEYPTSRRSMLELINRCSRQRQNDSIIAVSTWNKVSAIRPIGDAGKSSFH